MIKVLGKVIQILAARHNHASDGPGEDIAQLVHELAELEVPLLNRVKIQVCRCYRLQLCR